MTKNKTLFILITGAVIFCGCAKDENMTDNISYKKNTPVLITASSVKDGDAETAAEYNRRETHTFEHYDNGVPSVKKIFVSAYGAAPHLQTVITYTPDGTPEYAYHLNEAGTIYLLTEDYLYKSGLRPYTGESTLTEPYGTGYTLAKIVYDSLSGDLSGEHMRLEITAEKTVYYYNSFSADGRREKKDEIPTPWNNWLLLSKHFNKEEFRKLKNGPSYLAADGTDETIFVTADDGKTSSLTNYEGPALKDFFSILTGISEMEHFIMTSKKEK